MAGGDRFVGVDRPATPRLEQNGISIEHAAVARRGVGGAGRPTPGSSPRCGATACRSRSRVVRRARPDDLLSAPTRTKKLARLRHDPRASFLIESGERWAELLAVHLTGERVRRPKRRRVERHRRRLDVKYAAFAPRSPRCRQGPGSTTPGARFIRLRARRPRPHLGQRACRPRGDRERASCASPTTRASAPSPSTGPRPRTPCRWRSASDLRVARDAERRRGDGHRLTAVDPVFTAGVDFKEVVEAGAPAIARVSSRSIRARHCGR